MNPSLALTSIVRVRLLELGDVGVEHLALEGLRRGRPPVDGDRDLAVTGGLVVAGVAAGRGGQAQPTATARTSILRRFVGMDIGAPLGPAG
jgi:hypothetical protein